MSDWITTDTDVATELVVDLIPAKIGYPKTYNILDFPAMPRITQCAWRKQEQAQQSQRIDAFIQYVNSQERWLDVRRDQLNLEFIPTTGDIGVPIDCQVGLMIPDGRALSTTDGKGIQIN